jgi:hypothetical protein
LKFPNIATQFIVFKVGKDRSFTEIWNLIPFLCGVMQIRKAEKHWLSCILTEVRNFFNSSRSFHKGYCNITKIGSIKNLKGS